MVTLRDVDRAARRPSIRAKYVVGCDGARSLVRQSIGAVPRGDFANHAWGVMDMLAVTDFPDIRLKAAIQSADEGNILLIPREGGYLVRLYVDLGEIDPNNRDAFRDSTPQEKVIETAQRVLRPYTLDVQERRLVLGVPGRPARHRPVRRRARRSRPASRLPRVFIAGDACHTHSAKAGQGMNVSMQDAFNLGWKLASVLEGRAGPELLRTYSVERHAIAQGLIDFDKEWSKIMASPPKDPQRPELGGVDPAGAAGVLRQVGALHGRRRDALRADDGADRRRRPTSTWPRGFTIGMRFHSAPVVRLADAKPMQLGHAARADGAWRIYAFADASGERLRELAAFLAESPNSPIRRFTPAGRVDIDSVIDVRAVFQQGHRDLEVERTAVDPAAAQGMLRADRLREGLSAPDLKNGPDIFDLRGIDRAQGAMVVVRPDQYVSNVLPLDAHDELAAFFGRFLLDRH